jgi:monoamine oxidase
MLDVSPTNAGALIAFIGLPLIDDPSPLDPDATTRRRRQVLDDLAALYGPSARQPDDYDEDWATEPWHSGCLPRPPTGLLSRYQPWLTRPVGPNPLGRCRDLPTSGKATRTARSGPRNV